MRTYGPMKNSEKGLLLTFLIASGGAYAWGWSVRPQVTYQLEFPSAGGTPVPYYVNAGYLPNGSYVRNTSPLEIVVGADNEGATPITFSITVGATNATISGNQKGAYGQSATATLLVRAKESYGWKFYVYPYPNTPSFKLSITGITTVTRSDYLANLIYFVYSSSIYTPVNLQSLMYVRESPSSNAYDPQT
jgi:hypothetical protein